MMLENDDIIRVIAVVCFILVIIALASITWFQMLEEQKYDKHGNPLYVLDIPGAYICIEGNETICSGRCSCDDNEKK